MPKNEGQHTLIYINFEKKLNDYNRQLFRFPLY
ncbi:MAG: hypothetical protein RL365_142, partial [Bacteroidota bacterium]